MASVLYGQLFIFFAILALLIISQIPSSYSEVNSNRNLENIYESIENKNVYSKNNDNSENSLHSGYNLDTNYDFNQMNDILNLIDDQKDTNVINDQKDTNVINDQKDITKHSFKKDIGNDNTEYRGNFLYPSLNDNDLYGKVEDSNDYQSQDDESSHHH